VDGQWQQLRSALAEGVDSGLVTLEKLPDASLRGLQRALRQREYHVLHFIGHGAFDVDSQDGVLVMTDGAEQSQLVGSQTLGTLLHDYRSLRLVVLDCCEGGRTGNQDTFAGVAQELLRQQLPAVVAMQFAITDAAALTLSHEFYAALAEGEPVDLALTEARRAVFAQTSGVEWATPVLYMRAPDGYLFKVSKMTDAPRPAAPSYSVGSDRSVGSDQPVKPRDTIDEPPVPAPKPSGSSREAQPAPQLTHLRLDVAVPPQVPVRRAFTVAVSVRQPSSPMLVEADLPMTRSGDAQVSLPSDQPFVRLRIAVSAADCEIKGDANRLFRLYGGQDSPAFYFSLIPNVTGQIDIVVELYQEDDLLGSARANTTAGE
jgi:hypothetical protein